jgi:hypothetical protein
MAWCSPRLSLRRWRRPRPTRRLTESEHPGYCGAQDTFYVGNLKGVGRVYQQTFIYTYAKVACAKLYDRRRRSPPRICSMTGCCHSSMSIRSKLLRVLTDRGSGAQNLLPCRAFPIRPCPKCVGRVVRATSLPEVPPSLSAHDEGNIIDEPLFSFEDLLSQIATDSLRLI